MRRIVLMLLLLMPAILSQAQGNTTFTCVDDTTYRTQFEITPPDISEFVSEVNLTALGRGNFEPVIGVTAPDGFTDCYSLSPEADLYELNLPSGDIPSGLTNASGIVYAAGENHISIGSTDGESGALALVMEAFIFEVSHSYQLELTQIMLDSGDGLSAYLVSLVDSYEPSLTITDAEGTETIAESAEVNLISIYGDAISAVSAPLPQTPGTVTLTVNPAESSDPSLSGVYALIIELQSGDLAFGDGAATVTTSEDGAITLACDEETIFNNGMRLFFPDDNAYTVSVLGDSIDTVVAVLDEEDQGFCFDDSPATLSYSLELPSIALQPDIVYPQVVISPDDSSLVPGGKESAAGSYVLVIEGGQINADGDHDLFEIALTPQMLSTADVLVAYVFTTSIELDPTLTWLREDGDSVSCNDAGLPDLCDQELDEFSDSYLTYGDDLYLQGIDFNPMLEIPLEPDSTAGTILLEVSTEDASEGEYILVLHLVTD